jgi:hypothetical protein
MGNYDCWRHTGRRSNSSRAPKLGCGCAKYRRTRRAMTRKSRRGNR